MTTGERLAEGYTPEECRRLPDHLRPIYPVNSDGSQPGSQPEPGSRPLQPGYGDNVAFNADHVATTGRDPYKAAVQRDYTYVLGGLFRGHSVVGDMHDGGIYAARVPETVEGWEALDGISKHILWEAATRVRNAMSKP